MGPGTVHRIAAQGFDPFLLQYIFLTHLHSDHTLDLVTFLQLNDSSPARERIMPVYITGCRGTRDFYEGLMTVYPGIRPQSYALEIRETGEAQFDILNIHVSTILSGHTDVSLSYRFDTRDGSLVYTGDCTPSPALVHLCEGADVLICECSFPSGWVTSDHMNADHVGRLAEAAGVRRLIATHLYPPAVQADIAAQISRHYSGEIHVAVDGFRLQLIEKG